MPKLIARSTRAVAVSLVVLSLGACSNMNDMQQRMVSGGAIGVAGGAVGTAVTGGCIACGMAIGGAVGVAGGYIAHELDTQFRGSSSSSSSSSGYSGGGYSSNNSVPQGYPSGGYNAN